MMLTPRRQAPGRPVLTSVCQFSLQRSPSCLGAAHAVGIPHMFTQEMPPGPALPAAYAHPRKMHQKAESILKCSQDLRQGTVIICNLPLDFMLGLLLI